MSIKTNLLLVGLLGVFAVLLLVFTSPDQVQARPLGVTPPAQVLGITVGLYHPPTVNYATELSAVNSLTHKTNGVILYYLYWNLPFDTYLPAQVQSMPASTRPTIMIAWGPAYGQASLGCDQNYSGAVPWGNIAQGYCDTYIRNYANSAKALAPQRFLIKFAHEMNGGGTPWSPINVGVNPSGFVAAWRHVRDIFSTQGVTNVEWVWAPIYQSNPLTTDNDIHLYYPGDNYVDWIGPSGYNYYIYLPGAPQPWMPFTTIFDATLLDFACRYPKPQIIHEFASVEGSTSFSKTTWIADAYAAAQNYPFLRSIVWYNDFDNGSSADFRITTSTYRDGSVQPLPGGGAWTTAYSNAVSSSVFTHTLPTVSAATPPSTYCGNGQSQYTVQPTTVFLLPGESSTHQLIGLLYATSQSITFSSTSPKVTATANPTSLPPPWGKSTINIHADPSAANGVYTVTVHVGGNDLPIQVRVVSIIYNLELPFIVR